MDTDKKTEPHYYLDVFPFGWQWRYSEHKEYHHPSKPACVWVRGSGYINIEGPYRSWYLHMTYYFLVYAPDLKGKGR